MKGMIGSKSWPKILWLSMILDDGPSVQISANLEKILSILNFLALKTGFFSIFVAHLARPIGLGDPNYKWLAVLDFS